MAIIIVKGAQVDTNKYYMVKTIDHPTPCPVAFIPDGTYLEIGSLNPMHASRIESVVGFIGDMGVSNSKRDILLHCSVKTMARSIEDLGVHGYNDLLIFRISVLILCDGKTVRAFEDNFTFPARVVVGGKSSVYSHLKAELRDVMIEHNMITEPNEDYALTLDINSGALDHFIMSVAQ